MLKNYLISAIRNITKSPFYSFLNIAALAVGLTTFIFIFIYVSDELTFDKYHDQHERIYRLESDYTIGSKHDEFAIVETTLVRRFPIYKKGDANAKPTGGTRQLQYNLEINSEGKSFVIKVFLKMRSIHLPLQPLIIQEHDFQRQPGVDVKHVSDQADNHNKVTHQDGNGGSGRLCQLFHVKGKTRYGRAG